MARSCSCTARALRVQGLGGDSRPDALWRTLVTGDTTEELATPFDATARVNFYNLNVTPAQAAVPALAATFVAWSCC